MISNELLDEIIWFSFKNEFASKELLEKIVIDIVNNSDEITKNHFKGLEFVKSDWDFAVAGCYENGIITADYDALIEDYGNPQKSMLQNNLELIQCLMHEIGHLKHKSHKTLGTFESKLLKYSGASFISSIYFNRAYAKTNNIKLSGRIAVQKFRNFYENNIAIIPTERIAEIGSRKELLDSLKNYPSFDTKYFDEYKCANNTYIRSLKDGYHRLEKAKYSIPIIEYFMKLDRLCDLKKIGFDLDGRRLPEETIGFNSETKMLYGLPIKLSNVVEINKMKIKSRR